MSKLALFESSQVFPEHDEKSKQKVSKAPGQGAAKMNREKVRAGDGEINLRSFFFSNRLRGAVEKFSFRSCGPVRG